MLKGSLVALVTPFTSEGKIDYLSLERLIKYHIDSGTKGIVVMGTTGEGATLTLEEKKNIIKETIYFAKGKIPIVVGAGGNATSHVIDFINQIEEFSYDGILSVTPYYNKPTQNGMYLHYEAIAKATSKNILLYNVPGRTAVDLLPETVAALAKIDNIIGIKDATADLNRVELTQKLCGNSFIQLSGDDPTTIDFIKRGGHGSISVTANIAAPTMAKICSLALASKFDCAKALNDNIKSMHSALFIESNPIPVKWVLKKLELIDDDMLRLPLTRLTESSQDIIDELLNVIDFIDA